MRAVSRSGWPVWAGVSIAAAGLVFWHRSTRLSLFATEFTTGYLLIALIVFLALYGGRKRLSTLPIGNVSVWLSIHLGGGLLALALFWEHAGKIWPAGPLNYSLAALFYAVTVSGMVGYVLQLWLPGRLVHAGPEIIFERIPAEIADIRARVEAMVLEAADKTGHETLGQDYIQSLRWYFARPRFFWSNVFGGRRAEYWMQRHLHTIRRYLSEAERSYLAEIAALVSEKRRVDRQYALQALLKRWTIVHVPLATALLALAAWHFILVHVFDQ